MKDKEARIDTRKLWHSHAQLDKQLTELQQLVAELLELRKIDKQALNRLDNAPEVNLRGSEACLGFRDTVIIPTSDIIQMLLNHLNLEIVGEHIKLKEIDDER